MNLEQLAKSCEINESLGRLIELYCMDAPTENEIEDWFSTVDFEALRPEASCMAAAMADKNGCCGVQKTLIPRLEGIKRYVYTLNWGMTAGLCALGRQLAKEGTIAYLCDGTAVRFGCCEPPKRQIWQMQIGVCGDLQRLADIAKRAGFEVSATPYTLVCKNKSSQCVLVKRLEKPFERAKTVAVGSTQFLLPDASLVLISLANVGFELLRDIKQGEKLLPWIMDMHCVIRGITDWQQVSLDAKRQSACERVRLMLELYGYLAPDALPTGVTALFGNEKKVKRLIKLLIKYRSLENHRLRRLWVLSKITSHGSLLATLKAFFGALSLSLRVRLTRRN